MLIGETADEIIRSVSSDGFKLRILNGRTEGDR